MGRESRAGTQIWDISDDLKTARDVELYLEAVLEEDDPVLFAAALGDIARSRGMTEVARRTGLSRESLYKALSAAGNPEFATVLKVMRALGLRFHASASEPS